MTPQRVAIFKALLASGDHPRAEQIFDQVRWEQPTISVATVHRTLEMLCDAGEAGKVTLPHDSARYDGNTGSHHHVVCIRCRRVCDLDALEFDHLVQNRAVLGEFHVLGCAVKIRKTLRRLSEMARSHHRSRWNHLSSAGIS